MLLHQHEQTGNNRKNQALIKGFQDVVHLCEQQDMGYTGHAYTWSNKRGGEQNVQEWLDRFLTNPAWLCLFS